MVCGCESVWMPKYHIISFKRHGLYVGQLILNKAVKMEMIIVSLIRWQCRVKRVNSQKTIEHLAHSKYSKALASIITNVVVMVKQQCFSTQAAC